MRFITATAACLAVCLALCGPADGATDATGTTVMGYTFGSNVQGYLDISQDVCDIITTVDARDWTSADAIYVNGQNSINSAGQTRKLQEWATEVSEGEPHWGLYASHFGNDSDWLNTFIEAGLDGIAPWTTSGARAQVVKKGIQSNLLVAYMLHEVDEAAGLTEEKATDAAEGAPHIVDEAAAIYFSSTCPSGSIADVADKRATTFGTLTTGADGVCTAATNIAVASALKAMQAAGTAGDLAAYEVAAGALEKAIVTIFVQATLTYADELEALVAADNATVVESAEGTAFFRTIEPLVAEVAEEDAKAIAAALGSPSKGGKAKIEAAFAATLAEYGITAAELGTLNAASSCQLASATATATPTTPGAPSGGASGFAASSLSAALLAAAGAAAPLL